MTAKKLFLIVSGILAGMAVVAVVLILDPRRGPAHDGEQFLLPGPLPARDFTLTGHTGEPVHLADLTASGLAVLYFGYTSCPDICPLTLADLGRARGLLAADSTRVRIVFVSVDPARDTPARLAAYVARFRGQIVGLTGSQVALEKVAGDYLAFAQRAGAGVEPPMPGMRGDSMPAMGGMEGMAGDSVGYLIDHTARSFVVKDRQVVMTFPPQTTAPDIAAGLKLLLRR